ncbi:MAG: divalent-cation tolerance protein CutA [Spirochaetota bacterium]
MSAYLQLQTTFQSREDALDAAQRIISRRLAACAQVLGPITSVYRWEGKVEQDQEWLLLAKTTDRARESLEELITGIHPYDVPEVVFVPIEGGSAGYLSWLAREVPDPGGSPSR